MPAFFCGIFGHKPTGGLVPNSGQWPNAEGDALLYLTTGPLSRRAEDLMPLLSILAGPDGKDERCTSRRLGDPASVDIASLRVLDVRGNGRLPVSRVLVEAQARAARALAARGARVVPQKIEGLKRSLEIWSAMLGAGSATSFRETLSYGRQLHLGVELLKWSLGRSEFTLPAIGLALLEEIPKRFEKGAARFLDEGKRLRDEIVTELGDGVMLFPSYPRVAPRHHAALLPPIQWMYTAIFNVLELPVTQVPLGLDRRGVPLGVQVVGAHGNDHITIAVAMALQEAFGGWVPPRL
jgi:fatty acid amide hydrolase 2